MDAVSTLQLSLNENIVNPPLYVSNAWPDRYRACLGSSASHEVLTVVRNVHLGLGQRVFSKSESVWLTEGGVTSLRSLNSDTVGTFYCSSVSGLPAWTDNARLDIGGLDNDVPDYWSSYNNL